MSLEVKYIDAPPGAQKDMAVAATEANAVSKPQLLATGAQNTSWATLEPYGWPLDGSRDLMPDAPEVGFWSDTATDDSAGVLGISRLGEFILGVGEAEADFEEPPIITLSFPEKYTATGITFTFSPGTGEWCTEILVQWHNGETLLDEVIAYPDAARWTLVHTVESFDRICVELRRTNKAGHFAKMQGIDIGQTILFEKSELTAVQLVNEIDPMLSNLTVDTMTVQVQDRHNRDILPQENQRMELYRNGKLLATQYITEGSRQAAANYKFSCQSAIGLLEDTFLGGMYNDEPVENVVQDILDGRDYEMNDIFKSATVTGYLPVCTRREALQQLAFAMGSVVTTQQTDAFRFVELPDDVTGAFTGNSIFIGGRVDITPRVYRIDVAAHSYAPSDEEEILVENEVFAGEDILLTFDKPHHSYVITGGSITDSGVNYVMITADGEVTLTAKLFTHNKVTHSKHNPAATASERNNVQTVENATLVHAGNFEAVLERLFRFANARMTITQEAVISGQYAGQKITTDNPWGGQVSGYITAMESDFTPSGHTASVTIVGGQLSAKEGEE